MPIGCIIQDEGLHSFRKVPLDSAWSLVL